MTDEELRKRMWQGVLSEANKTGTYLTQQDEKVILLGIDRAIAARKEKGNDGPRAEK